MAEIDGAVAASSGDAVVSSRASRIHAALVDMNTIIASVLHDFRLAHPEPSLTRNLDFGFYPRPLPGSCSSYFTSIVTTVGSPISDLQKLLSSVCLPCLPLTMSARIRHTGRRCLYE
jgi:hypothetical protein